MTQSVKNLTAMQETWVSSLGLENPSEKGKATHSSILAWRIPWTIQYTVYSPRGHKELEVTEQLSLHFDYTIYYISVPNNDFHEKNFENSLMVLREF